VISYFKKSNLAESVAKYKFYKEYVEFLGYILSKDNISISDEKVELIQDWKSPTI
jgi:hypothetical protein